MKRQRKRYSPEFKQEAVDLVHRSGRSANQIAQELGISQTAICRWIRAADAAPGTGNVFAAQEELKRLQKENERLRMERDILKKATAFFAKESQ
jgi:transposase